MSSPSVINLDYLRSGRMFVDSSPLPNERAVRDLTASPSANARLETFHQKTHEAVESAVSSESLSSDFKVAKSTPISIVNTDFLRSGQEFTSATPPSGASQTREPLSSTIRLNKYHEATHAAVEKAVKSESVSGDFKIAKCEPKTIVNTQFLCSGNEFVSSSSFQPPQRERTSSMNERLQRFYDETQSAMKRAVQYDAVTSDFKVAKCNAPSIVNVDFLRSGREFSPVPSADNQEQRTRAHSMNERLQQFYETTQAAVAKAVEQESVSSDFKVAKCPTTTIVNVDFLRSGAEFSPSSTRRLLDAPRTPSPTTSPTSLQHVSSSPARLERYHARTAAAIAKAVQLGVVCK